jgi:hypothetical protein
MNGSVSPDDPAQTSNQHAGENDNNKVAISGSYVNAPATHLELGAVVGAFVGPEFLHAQMKVDGGKYASNPLSRAMTMAVASYRFWPLDADGTTKTERQRWAMFAGGVLTPAPGLGGGVSRTLIKNLAADIGWAAMWVQSAPGTSKAGDTVVTDSKGNQLNYRWTNAFFAGGTFVFSGGK